MRTPADDTGHSAEPEFPARRRAGRDGRAGSADLADRAAHLAGRTRLGAVDLVLAGAYLLGLRSARRAGCHWPPGRIAGFFLGLLTIVLAVTPSASTATPCSGCTWSST